MSKYINQYLSSEYAKDHINASMITSTADIYRTMGIVNALAKLNPFDSLKTNTEIVCFVVGEGIKPMLSTTIATLYPKWFIYSYDLNMQKTIQNTRKRKHYPNLMEINVKLKDWRSRNKYCGLDFNPVGDGEFNAKNVVIVAFDHFEDLHYLFKGIDPLNITMLTIQKSGKKIKDLDEMITQEYTDKNIKTKENVLKVWNFKRLGIKSESNRKRWIFHFNRLDK